MITTAHSKFAIYPNKESKMPLCRLAAETKRAAMKKARAMFRIPKGAVVVLDTIH
jgi:hypothetical protein